MNLIRNDRIIPLKSLASYPASATLDMVLWLPQTENRLRHIWLMTSEDSPEIYIDDVIFSLSYAKQQEKKWLDYGVSEIPTGFTQLRIKGISQAASLKSYLLITEKLDYTPKDKFISEIERDLFGISREQAGRTSINPCRVQVGQPARFTVTYHAGNIGLPAGALVRFTVPKAFSEPQTAQPNKPGYVRIGSKSCEIEIKDIIHSTESHVYYDIICALNTELDHYRTFELIYKTDFTYIFPHTFTGTDRPFWYVDLPPLSAAVAVSENQKFVSLADCNGHSVEFYPGPAERLHLILPGSRNVNEKLTLTGIVTDLYRNRPSCGYLDLDCRICLVGDGNRKIHLGTPAEHLIDKYMFQIPLPQLECGIYRAVAIEQKDGKQKAISNPLKITPAGSERIFWGEIHSHTEMSDGTGSFNGLYRHTKEVGKLDFAAAADHACYFTDNQWLQMCDITNAWNESGNFVTLVGYEWAGKQVHRNFYTSSSRLKLFRGMYEPTSSLDKVFPYFHDDKNTVAGPHAPLGHGIKMDFHDPEVERFIEVYSMWGASDFRENPYAPLWARDQDRQTVNEILKNGYKLGFTGGGDCHEGKGGFPSEAPQQQQGKTPHTFAPRLLFRCGLTAAVMFKLNRECLIKSLRNRKTYATTGARILLDFNVCLNKQEKKDFADNVICIINVNGTSLIKEVNIIKDGKKAFSRELNCLDASFNWHDNKISSGEHYYYLHVIQNDGHMAWSSPVWITCEE